MHEIHSSFHHTLTTKKKKAKIAVYYVCESYRLRKLTANYYVIIQFFVVIKKMG